jgi:hypothetical protein
MPKMKLLRVSGSCRATATTAPTYSLNDVMRRTSQLVGLYFSTGRSISPLPVIASLANARLIFHDLSRARSRRSSCQLGKLAFN